MVIEGLGDLVGRQLRKDGDAINVPGLVRLRLQKKKAVKGGKTVPNPFRPGETMVTKDKPARNVIKVRVLKGLTESVQ